MRKTIAVVVFLVAVLSASLGFAQNPNYDVGAVWRVTYMHLKPGMGDVFWNDFRQHIKPVLDEQKKQGLISDYKAFINPTTNQPNDWDVALATLYPNWASLFAAEGFIDFELTVSCPLLSERWLLVIS